MAIETMVRKPLRLMPAFVLASLIPIAYAMQFFIWPDEPLGMLGGAVAMLLIMLWWVFFSRAPWVERLIPIVLAIPLLRAAKFVVDPSIAGAGQGMMQYIFGLQFIAIALVIMAALSKSWGPAARRSAIVAAVFIGCVPLLMLRTSGILGGGPVFHWRWTPSAEERLLARAEAEPKPVEVPKVPEVREVPKVLEVPEVQDEPKAVDDTKVAVEAPHVPEVTEWPGFRGPNRDSVVREVQIKTDWTQTPPTQIWRRAIGPGWSSFAVRGDVLYTQEQRGDDEIVAAYRVSTGEPVWRHRDPIRFYESNGGAGPRGTPTLEGSRVFSLGATGWLNALDATTGKVLWARNAAEDTKRKVPEWGISSSPLVIDDVVVVSLAGTLAAYDVATGKPRWTGPQHGGSYSSPHLVTVDGVKQVVILSAPGAVSVSPADGKVMWEHTFEGGAITQPAIVDGSDILVNGISMMGGVATRRLAIKHTGESWSVEEKWTSNGLKPYFNDLVIHKGHAFGFDNNILSCIDLADGKRKWKGGRYGNGQMVLLADQDLLLVMSEEGELALVSATTDQFKELARFRALDAKTWNHPVLVHDILLVRNGEEMAAFKLSLEPAATRAAVP